MSIDAIPKPFRGPWQGDAKIILGIDIGTTQSNVAFSFLQEGGGQLVHNVSRWPGQEACQQQGKIPTIVWYDTNQRAVAFGAEAQLPTTEEQAEDNGWVLAKHFKLHLYPSDMLARHGLTPDSLPPGVSLSRIYSDFLGYLLHHTKTYFEDRIPDGKSIWEQYSPAMEVVITHPNGWGLREESFLRLAAITAGFSTPDRASSKVRFVSEAEGLVYSCIYDLRDRFQPIAIFLVCDVSDFMAKSTLYSVISALPFLKFEKVDTVCVPSSHNSVDFEVEKFLRTTLAGVDLSPSEVEEHIKTGVKELRFALHDFGGETSDIHIRVGNSYFHNSAIRTRRGRMSISGSIAKGFFDPFIKEITKSVDQQLESHNMWGTYVSHIILAGKFASNPY
ncbi:unnamed protein product [Rhizoctonia solani]|nr:unnamed protein product [Rhizoctonia solani]